MISSGSTTFSSTSTFSRSRRWRSPHRIDSRVARLWPSASSIRMSAGDTHSRVGAVTAAVGLVNHHALGEQALEGFLGFDMAGLAHGTGEEAGIEQMQDRMLDAADILIDRQPAISRSLVGWFVFPRCGEAGVIPARDRRRYPWCRFRDGHPCRIAGRRHAAMSDGGRADCPAGRR